MDWQCLPWCLTLLQSLCSSLSESILLSSPISTFPSLSALSPPGFWLKCNYKTLLPHLQQLDRQNGWGSAASHSPRLTNNETTETERGKMSKATRESWSCYWKPASRLFTSPWAIIYAQIIPVFLCCCMTVMTGLMIANMALHVVPLYKLAAGSFAFSSLALKRYYNIHCQ